MLKSISVKRGLIMALAMVMTLSVLLVESPVHAEGVEANFDYNISEGILRALAFEAFDIINEIRKENGLEPFKWRGETRALIRANELISDFSHNSVSNVQCSGENVAMGPAIDPHVVVASWMKSPGHKRAILNTYCAYAAIGVAQKGNMLYWANDFFSAGSGNQLWQEDRNLPARPDTDHVAGIVMTSKALSMRLNDNMIIDAYVFPTTAKNRKIIWETSNPKVARIDKINTPDDIRKEFGWDENEKISWDSKAYLTCVGVGEAKITARSEDGGFQVTYDLGVYQPADKLPKIKISAEPSDGWTKRDEEDLKAGSYVWISPTAMYNGDIEMVKGSSLSLKAIVDPSLEDKSVTWSSDRPDVVSVDSKGFITAHKEYAPAIITAKASNGDTTSIGVYVERKVGNLLERNASVTFAKKEVKIKVGETINLQPTVLPTMIHGIPVDTSVKWTACNPSIASVDSKGNVKGLEAGTTSIMVQSNFSEIYAQYTLIVEENKTNPSTPSKPSESVKPTVKKPALKSIYIDPAKATLYTGGKLKLKAMPNPEGATLGNVTWPLISACLLYRG